MLREDGSKRIDCQSREWGAAVAGLSLREFATIRRIITVMDEAHHESEIILIILSVFAHEICTERMVTHLRAGRGIVLIPRSFGGALLFRNSLQKEKAPADILTAETSTLPYACRKLDPLPV